MTDPAEQARLERIRTHSATLEELRERINLTVLLRDRSPEARERWSTACAEFHRRYPELHFPGGSDEIKLAKQGTPEGIVTAIDFLVADPMHFRSGYVKEELWRWSKRWALLPSDVLRLQRAALVTLTRPMSREFRTLCAAMAKHGTSAFWREVETLAGVNDPHYAKRASLLLEFRVNAGHGGLKLRAFMRESFDRKWREKQRERA